MARSLSAINLVTNPSAESGASTGWGPRTNCTVAVVGTPTFSGTKAFQLTRLVDATGQQTAYLQTLITGIAVGPGKAYSGSVQVQAATIARSCQIRFLWIAADGVTQVAISTSPLTGGSAVGSWTTNKYEGIVAPAGAAYVEFRIEVIAAAEAEAHYIDAAIFVQGATAPAFFDGNTTDAEWTGTPNLSISALYTNTYRAAVMANNPVAYWRMGETSGPHADTATVGPFPLSVSTAEVEGVDGLIGGDSNLAADFQGSTNAGTTTYDTRTAMEAAQTFSVEAWVRRLNSAATGSRLVIWCGASAASVAGWNLQLSLNSNTQFLRCDGVTTQNTFFGSVGFWNDNAPHHVVATYDGSTETYTMYVDGAQKSQNVRAALTIPVLSDGIHVGVGTSSTTHWPGAIDEVALYNIALSQAQVSANYAVGVSSGLAGDTGRRAHLRNPGTNGIG